VTTHDQDTAVTNVNKPLVLGQQRDCLIVIHHKEKDQQGKRLELVSGTARIGRDEDSELVLLDEGVSRRHVRVERSGDAWLVMDVGSRNGTLLNGAPLSGVKRLKNGDLLKLGSVIIKYLSGHDVETSLYEEMFQLAVTDNLTQLHNRRRFDEVLATEFGRVRRHGRDLSLLMLDIDFFKRVNDEHGHPAGDAVLFHVGQLIRSRVRDHDTAARIGGEELAILMPETDLAGARTLAEQLRKAIEELVVEYAEQQLRVTVSIGCAQFEPSDADPAAFVKRCDDQLYAAKSGGRNRVCG
jgi:two-component system, cell cycle response regulator